MISQLFYRSIADKIVGNLSIHKYFRVLNHIEHPANDACNHMFDQWQQGWMPLEMIKQTKDTRIGSDDYYHHFEELLKILIFLCLEVRLQNYLNFAAKYKASQTVRQNENDE